jgi:uncharacterized protein
MMRRRLIRRARRRAQSDATASGAATAFWLLLALAIVIGGARAVQGLPVLADAVLPQGMIAAHAAGEEPSGVIAMALHTHIHAGFFAPEILTPVAAGVRPEWLDQSARAGDASALRGSELDSDHVTAGTAATAPRLALVIDDLGSDVASTLRAIRLPTPVSLSFLPYPDATPMLARAAERAGHQVLVHVPMEPEGRDDPGKNALLDELSADAIAARLSWALDRVPGFSGINNHMGSRFTADRTALLPVMKVLADRHVFFLDSRTTPRSVVVPMARACGVASAARDVFLDDTQTVDAIDAQLALAERIARVQGVVIAIGHPHMATLVALENWAAHLRGVELISIGEAVRLEARHQALVSAGN